MREITVCFAYYENAGMLQRQYDYFGSYPQHLKDFLRLIVVDDGSPKAPAIPPREGQVGFPVSLYRMDVDIRWNQDACRNIAAHHCETKWMLLTDIDHLVPMVTMDHIMKMELSKRRVYRFSRLSEPKMEPYKSHPNSWLLTKAMFDKAGGYDERFAGWYGTDFDIMNRLKEQAGVIKQLDEPLIRVPREVTPDASTTQFSRKSPEDKENITRIRKERSLDSDPMPKRLLFPYHKVA